MQGDTYLFIHLPPDVLISIIEYLPLSDILSLRLSCSKLWELSKERTVWTHVVQKQHSVNGIPRPPELTNLQGLSVDDIIHLALRTHRAERRWGKPRTGMMERITRTATTAGPTILLGMQVLLDRWLVLVYAEGVIQIHDICDDISLRPSAEIEWDRAPGSQWASYTVAVDSAYDKAIIAVARCVPPYVLAIFTVNLEDCANGQGEFALLKQLSVESPKIVHAISPERALLAVSAASKVQLVDISGFKADAGNEGAIIDALNHDDLWNGINAIRFMGSYLLVARTRSIEVHHVHTALNPTDTKNKMPSLSWSFSMTTFKDFSLSESVTVANPTSEIYEIAMLAYDVIQGLFRYKVELYVPSSNQNVIPRLTVTQAGLYPLGLPLHTPTSLGPSPPLSRTHETDTPTPTFSHTHFLQNLGHLAHGTSSATSRGFLSTFSMGAQGLRAIWVERRRGGVAREVQVWGCSSTFGSAPSAAWVYRFGADCEEMEKKVVYTINSYDLRDDIISCAFSESRGIIALGNRLGNVSILPIE